jgi:hypothetical protein
VTFVKRINEREITKRLINILREHKDRWMRTPEIIELMNGEVDSRLVHLFLSAVPGIEHDYDTAGKYMSLWHISKKPAEAYLSDKDLTETEVNEENQDVED